MCYLKKMHNKYYHYFYQSTIILKILQKMHNYAFGYFAKNLRTLGYAMIPGCIV